MHTYHVEKNPKKNQNFIPMLEIMSNAELIANLMDSFYFVEIIFIKTVKTEKKVSHEK